MPSVNKLLISAFTIFLAASIATELHAQCSIVTLNQCSKEELCEKVKGGKEYAGNSDNKFMQELKSRGEDCKAPDPYLREDCSTLGQLARLIMAHRQAGQPISELIETETRKLYRQIIITAYEIDRFSSVVEKENAVDDFSNDVMLACYKSQQHLTD